MEPHPLDIFEPGTYDPEKQSLTLKSCTAVFPDKDTIFGNTTGIGHMLADAGDIFWRVQIVNPGVLNVALNVTKDDASLAPEFEVEMDNQKISAQVSNNEGSVTLGSVTISKPGTVTVSMRAKGQFRGLFVSVQLSGPAAVGASEERIPFEIRTVILQMNEDTEYDLIYCSVKPTVSSMGTMFNVISLKNGSAFALKDANWDDVKMVEFSLGLNSEEFVYPWKLGETYHFLVTAVRSNEEKVITVSGYFYINEESKWKLIKSFKESDDPMTLLKGPSCSISQYYGLQRGYYRREAYFGPAWARVPGGDFEQLSTAEFYSASCERLPDNIDAAVVDSAFVLRTGGDVKLTLPLSTTLVSGKVTQLPEILNDIQSKLEA